MFIYPSLILTLYCNKGAIFQGQLTITNATKIKTGSVCCTLGQYYDRLGLFIYIVTMPVSFDLWKVLCLILGVHTPWTKHLQITKMFWLWHPGGPSKGQGILQTHLVMLGINLGFSLNTWQKNCWDNIRMEIYIIFFISLSSVHLLICLCILYTFASRSRWYMYIFLGALFLNVYAFCRIISTEEWWTNSVFHNH